MSECEELNTLKEKLGELKETVAEMTDTISSILAVATEIEERNVREVVKELVEKAENWDYGLKGWRTLETKQDLINYLKKEVLEA